MMTRQDAVRVLVVDDSALMRQLMSAHLSADPEIEVIGTAPDPHVARERIKALNPDVVTLDIEMPHMDGITFLRKIMTLRPMPVVMVSTLTQRGAEVTLEALGAGAIDFVAKPVNGTPEAHAEFAHDLQVKIKAAGRTRLKVRRPAAAPGPTRHAQRPFKRAEGKIVFIGASTGGVEALKEVLLGLPENCPPVLVTQHMPPRFTLAFAERLDRECAMKVSEATDNERVEPGHVYIAPGGFHLEIVRSGTHHVCSLSTAPLVSGHRPSVNVLFESATRHVGAAAVGVILTGMGKDGADGMLSMRNAGAITLGQDEATSLIYGMPRAAFERGAVARQIPITAIADAILHACEAGGGRERQAREPSFQDHRP
jgi:two-component system chemotaxis response regulator CheB